MPAKLAPPTTGSSSSSAVRLILILAAAVVLFGLVAYYNPGGSARQERFASSMPPAAPQLVNDARVPRELRASVDAAGGARWSPPASEPLRTEQYRPVSMPDGGLLVPKNPFPQDLLKPEELLPKNAANSRWAKANPAGTGDLRDQNLLTAGYHVGVNTTGQSLRNANMQLRSEPPNPQMRVSIWSQSTIDPDLARRPLE